MKACKVAIFTLFVSIFMFNCLPLASAEDNKIGYVNLSEAFDEYERTKQSDKSLGKKSEKNEKKRKKLADEVRKLKDEMVLLSDKAKEKQQVAIDEKIMSLQQFVKDARDELKRERDEMLRDILVEINKVIQDYGKKNNYTAILNDRSLVYAKETIDITQDIIDILNKKKQQ